MRRSTQALLLAAGAAAAVTLVSRRSALGRVARGVIDDVRNRKRRGYDSAVDAPGPLTREDLVLANRYDRYAG